MRFLLDFLETLEAKILGCSDDSFRSIPVGKTRSLPFELSSLHRLRKHICMHKIGAEVLDGDVSFRHSFRHPEMTNVDVPGPLGSGPSSLHQCHATEVVLIDNHGTNGVALLLHKVLEVDSLSSGFGEANKLCLGA